MVVSDSIKSWLLEPSDPSVRYRTYVELLATPADKPEVAEAFMAIPASVAVRQILDRMRPDGYWLQQKPRTLAGVGDGVEYGSFATTHFCLSYLAHLGMNLRNKLVALAANRYLDLIQSDGNWYKHFLVSMGTTYRLLTCWVIVRTNDFNAVSSSS